MILHISQVCRVSARCRFHLANLLLLVEFGDEGAADWKEEESLDPDLKNDPIYHTNMKVGVNSTAVTLSLANPSAFRSTLHNFLSPAKRRI